MYQPRDVVTSMDEIYADMRRPYASQTGKFIDHVDPHIRAWIEASTFRCLATVEARGNEAIYPPPGAVPDCSDTATSKEGLK